MRPKPLIATLTAMVFSVSDGWYGVLFQVMPRPRAAKLDESRGALWLWQDRCMRSNWLE
jgi:hypothetical protein